MILLPFFNKCVDIVNVYGKIMIIFSIVIRLISCSLMDVNIHKYDLRLVY